MQIKNLNEEDVKTLQVSLTELRKINPLIEVKVYDMEDMDFAKRLTAIEISLNAIINKLNHIFGESVLIKGKWHNFK